MEKIITIRRCEAYPKKDIPADIWFNEVKHKDVRKDQHGEYVFEKS